MILEVMIKTNARKQSIDRLDNFVKISLKSQPIEGKANDELIKMLSKKCGISRADITIKSGLHSKKKLLDIRGITEKQLMAKLLDREKS